MTIVAAVETPIAFPMPRRKRIRIRVCVPPIFVAPTVYAPSSVRLSNWVASWPSQPKERVDRIAHELGLEHLSHLPVYRWDKVHIRETLRAPKVSYSKREAEQALTRLGRETFCTYRIRVGGIKLLWRADRSFSAQFEFLKDKDYWEENNSALETRICDAVAIVDQEFQPVDRSAFISEFCSAAFGVKERNAAGEVEEQCGYFEVLQASRVATRVLSGVFRSGTESADLKTLILRTHNGYIYSRAQKEFVAGWNSVDSFEIFERRVRLMSEGSGNGLGSPIALAQQILREVQTSGLAEPQVWRKNLEADFTEKEFLTSSQSALGQALALELDDAFYLSIQTVLRKMQEEGVVSVDSFSPSKQNDADCLGLLALSSKLSPSSPDDDGTLDRDLLRAAIRQHFSPEKAISRALNRVAVEGDHDLIGQLREIFQDTEQISLLDEAVATFHNLESDLGSGSGSPSRFRLPRSNSS